MKTFLSILLLSGSLLCQTPDKLFEGIGLSLASGIALGFRESYDFGYKPDNLLSGTVKDWYMYRPVTDQVFGKVFTFGKIFRELDVISSCSAMITLNEYFHNWIYSYLVYWVIKNTLGTVIRDKMKHNDFFYSFKVNLII